MSNTIHIQYYKTKIGELILGSFEGKLCLLDFRYRKMRTTLDNKLRTNLKALFVECDNDLLIETRNQIKEFIEKRRTEFNLPLLLVGTDFQKKVWMELIKVGYGTTSTYLQLAKNIGNEKAVRAVANANGANTIALIIPCHRIIGSDGSLVGYGGGLAIKKRLLSLEEKSYDLFES